MRNKTKKCAVALMTFCTMTASLIFPGEGIQAAYGESEAMYSGLSDLRTVYNEAQAAFITFSDTQATVKGLEEGCSATGTAVTISEAGTYVFSGNCVDGSITVKKGTTGVKLILNGLDLTSASAVTGPVLCKAGTETEIIAEAGTVNTLTDSMANTEEKAAVKVNKQSSLTLSGAGTLNVVGVCKNGIKGGAETDITVQEQNLHIKSADNGLASDNTVTVKSGKLMIEAGGDGIKSSPDRLDDAGNADDTVSLGDIILESGEINIIAAADGIQGDNSVTVNGGSYQITTNGGYTTTLASIRNCYEGLEAGTVYVNSGTININSTDDGVNAAGGNDGSGSNGRPGDGFNPGGGRPGNMGGGPGGRLAVMNTDPVEDSNNSAAITDSTYAAGNEGYAININGGTLYVKAAGDGLDSNGDISISGGNIIVYGAAAGDPGSDNFPFDHDGSFAISGGYIFGAGSSQMEEGVQSSTQGYIVNKNTYSQGDVICVLDGQGNVLFTEALAERVNYMMYSSPEMTASGNYSFKMGADAGQIDISECQITLEQQSYTYNGIAKQPRVTVSHGGKALIKNQDYTVGYSSNINAGTAKVTVKGMGSYQGTVEREFVILEKSEESTNPGGGTNPGGSANPGGNENPGGTAYQKPAKVKGLSASSVNAAKIKISWKKAVDADGYLLYRYDGKKKAWKCIKTITKGIITSYIDSGLASGTAFKYRVCAFTSADKKYKGDFSNSVTTATKPSKVSIKTVTAKKKALALKWKKTAGSGYEITYSSKKNFSGAKTVKINGASKSSCTVKKLKSKKTYYVKIRAYKKVGGKIYRGPYSARNQVKTK
ncbi:MAG: carbohydrate-binding domain-containing protein [Lachnospiraceae bacterium]|nr:carbohydrate-binding domain-containing protein [Lachnospiraceae bacterium]